MAWHDWLLPAFRAQLKRQDERIKTMALNIDKLRADLTALANKEQALETTERKDIGVLKQQIADLKAKAGSGETITQADLDALDGTVTGISGKLDSVTADLDAAAAPEPPAVG